jgi:hypothetical protein
MEGGNSINSIGSRWASALGSHCTGYICGVGVLKTKIIDWLDLK